MDNQGHLQPGISVEKTNSRNTYLDRVRFVENRMINEPFVERVFQIGEARVLAQSNLCIIPSELKETDTVSESQNTQDVANISLFIPGIYDELLEAKLAGALLTGKVDVLLALKAQGLNTESYRGVGEEIMGEVCLQAFINSISEYLSQNPEKKRVVLRVIGNSEGCTQGVSFLAKLINFLEESRLKEVFNDKLENIEIDGFVAISGSGLVGEIDQSKVLPMRNHITQTLHRIGNRNSPVNIPETDPKSQIRSETDQRTLHIRHVPIQIIQEYERILTAYIEEPGIVYDKSEGPPYKIQEETPTEPRTVEAWLKRFFASRIPFAPKVLTGLLDKPIHAVPFERMKALFAYNHDWEKVLFSPLIGRITVVANERDTFFNEEDVQESLREIIATGDQKEIKGKLQYVKVVGGEHGSPHTNPKGYAFMLEMINKG